MVLGDKLIQIELLYKRRSKEFKCFLDKSVIANILSEISKLRTQISKHL